MTSAQTISPNEPAYYVDHSTAVLHDIVARYLDMSAQIAENTGDPVHPLSLEAMLISNAAWMALVIRGEA